MTQIDPARQPKGIPNGGQFAGTAKAEPDIDLTAQVAEEGASVAQRLAEFDEAINARDEAEERVHHEAAKALAEHLRTIIPDATHAFVSWDDDRDEMALTSVLTSGGFHNSDELIAGAQPLVSQMPDTLPATYDATTGEFGNDPDYPYLSGNDDELVVDLSALRGPSTLADATQARAEASERVVETVVRHVADKVIEAYPQATHLEIEWGENCVERTYVIAPGGAKPAHRSVVTHADTMEFPRTSDSDWAEHDDGVLTRIDLYAARS